MKRTKIGANQVKSGRQVRFVEDVNFGAFMILVGQKAEILPDAVGSAPSIPVVLRFFGGIEIESLSVKAPRESVRVVL